MHTLKQLIDIDNSLTMQCTNISCKNLFLRAHEHIEKQNSDLLKSLEAWNSLSAFDIIFVRISMATPLFSTCADFVFYALVSYTNCWLKQFNCWSRMARFNKSRKLLPCHFGKFDVNSTNLRDPNNIQLIIKLVNWKAMDATQSKWLISWLIDHFLTIFSINRNEQTLEKAKQFVFHTLLLSNQWY